ncbi:hypothetical protein [Streptomyces sp. NRRL S-920]|uniref:hypothetical protein n=1 Tax=Streptomyces sp. NRRL S-920 TaxID=1463921 RepID=UPI0004CB238A|nr:hypothetical protein [Streptomyces sp. NRRL S-920]
MYRIAICRKGQAPDLRAATGAGDLRDVVYEVIRAEGTEIKDTDHAGLVALIGSARAMVDADGFAGLTFGAAAIAIRSLPVESS